MSPRLGAVLVNRGLLSPEALDAALAVRDDEDALLGEILTGLSRSGSNSVAVSATVR